MRRLRTRTALLGASAVGVVWAATSHTGAGERARRACSGAFRALRDRTRYLRHASPGIRYRLAGRHPDREVSDDVLADRVRSALGRVERRLDVPHVRVHVHDGVVVLHGPVPTHVDAHEIEFAVHRVAGVRGVESYLHVGLGSGDTRPSEGRSHPAPSKAYTRLLEAARRASAPAGQEQSCVRAVLAAFMDRLPRDEREHVLAHLPADARMLAQAPRRHGAAKLNTLDALDDEVERVAGVDGLVADALTDEVLRALRELVPEEVADVAAVLPAGLRAAWARAS